MRRTAQLLSLCTLACCASPVAPDANGQWGSQRASLTISRDGGTLMLQCGSGKIDALWTITDDGAFTGNGATFGGGGPEPIGGRPAVPARFTGQVSGNTFTLTATIIATGATVGPFRMKRDGPAVSMLCL